MPLAFALFSIMLMLTTIAVIVISTVVSPRAARLVHPLEHKSSRLEHLRKIRHAHRDAQPFSLSLSLSSFLRASGDIHNDRNRLIRSHHQRSPLLERSQTRLASFSFIPKHRAADTELRMHSRRDVPYVTCRENTRSVFRVGNFGRERVLLDVGIGDVAQRRRLLLLSRLLLLLQRRRRMHKPGREHVDCRIGHLARRVYGRPTARPVTRHDTKLWCAPIPTAVLLSVFTVDDHVARVTVPERARVAVLPACFFRS